jgi:hypothetical protein
LEEKPDGALAPRCVKDLIEEKLFDRRRDLFTDLSAVFMDTTSLSFYGEGGETLGEHGYYSKDYRPDLKQMILGLVVDGDGRPICTEMWSGKTADVTTLLPVIDRLRLRSRFHFGRVCVVADRGMISAETVAGLRRLTYLAQKGLAFRSKRSMCVVVARDFAPRDNEPPRRSHPSGARLSEGSGSAGPSSRRRANTCPTGLPITNARCFKVRRVAKIAALFCRHS